MMMNPDRLLDYLGQQLELRQVDPLTIVVCGGSALNVMGLVERPTRDIDVLGRLEDEGVVRADLPDGFWAAADTVAREFDLDEKWINAEPSIMVETGLPEGLADRLTIRRYGSRLSAGYIARIDQVYFKLWASADRGGYHAEDLRKLDPTPDEIRAAARWCLEQDPSEGFRRIMVDMLGQLGFDDVAESI